MVLTIVGWANVTKALIILVAPDVGMRSLQRVSVDRGRELIMGGAVFLVLSALMWYLVLVR